MQTHLQILKFVQKQEYLEISRNLKSKYQGMKFIFNAIYLTCHLLILFINNRFLQSKIKTCFVVGRWPPISMLEKKLYRTSSNFILLYVGFVELFSYFSLPDPSKVYKTDHKQKYLLDIKITKCLDIQWPIGAGSTVYCAIYADI